MKHAFFAVILGLFVTISGAQSRGCGCAASRAKMRCDYYVVKKGDRSKRAFCADYANRADLDGAAGRAAWYWILAGKPDKALASVRAAIKAHHMYAAEYGAFASMMKGNQKEGMAYWRLFIHSVRSHRYAYKDRTIVEKLYPAIDFSNLK